MQFIYSKLPKSLVIFIAGLSLYFQGCNLENDLTVGPVSSNIENETNLQFLGFDADSIIEKKDFYIVEHDIIVRKTNLSGMNSTSLSKTNQVGWLYKFAPQIAKDIKVKIDPSLAAYESIIQSALDLWNNKGAAIHLRIDNTTSSPNITIFSADAPNCPEGFRQSDLNAAGANGFGDLTHWDGAALITSVYSGFKTASLYYQKHLIAHEIGHNIGFQHTDHYGNYSDNTLSISYTPYQDYTSVMLSASGYLYLDDKGVTRTTTPQLPSVWDIFALQQIYPMFSPIVRSWDGIAGFDLGDSRDRIVAADYNGDGKNDLILYRPSQKTIFIGRSVGDGTFINVLKSWNGIAGFDLADSRDCIVAADYNGDGKDDLILYRPSQKTIFIGRSVGDGTFINVLKSWNGIAGFDLGDSRDRIVAADYNGDGKDDLILYRPGTKTIFIGRSVGDGTFINAGMSWNGIAGFDLGDSKDRIVAADYNGDGKDDLVLYRPGNGILFIGKSNGYGTFSNVAASWSGMSTFDIRANNDIILPLDYNNDRLVDLAFYRPGNKVFFLGRSEPVNRD